MRWFLSQSLANQAVATNVLTFCQQQLVVDEKPGCPLDVKQSFHSLSLF